MKHYARSDSALFIDYLKLAGAKHGGHRLSIDTAALCEYEQHQQQQPEIENSQYDECSLILHG
jgi:hypothetical protein